MPFAEIQLIPGVDTTKTPTLNQAGYSISQLIRYREGLAQKLGGWTRYWPNAVGGTPRDLHAWRDLNASTHLAVATTTELDVITSGSLATITPQTFTTNGAPAFTTTINSASVTVNDPNIANVTVLDAIYLNTPIAIGGLVLSGVYQIISIGGGSTYTINASAPATSNAGPGGAVPVFTTTAASATVSVAITAHGLSAGNRVYFTTSTAANGVTIQGAYVVNIVTDPNDFTITVNTQATSGGAFSMNAGNAQIVYYINLGAPAAGTGFGIGGFGVGGFGSGASPTVQTGAPITAVDWTSDNWGQILLECPRNGGVYAYDPTAGNVNAQFISSAPTYAGGLFVSTSQQILVVWGATASASIGSYQDPLLVAWSDSGDYTDFTPTITNQAGSYRIPFGNVIRAGLAVSSQNLLFTDTDCWAMTYIQPPLVYSFNRIGAGTGAVSCHSPQALRGRVYWMGTSNFFVYDGSSVSPIPCPVWDVVFQNLNTSALGHVRSMPNTAFDEVGWFYPSASSSGECDSYVKFNVNDPRAPWDIGILARSAWLDQSILVPTPLGASPNGVVYQHDNGTDADGQILSASFTTGYAVIGNGEDFTFVDSILPDMKWGLYGGASNASVTITLNVIDYPNALPRVYGPYVMTATTQYIPVRFRGRQVSATLASSDLGSFWRIGSIRYRYAAAGRR